MGKFMGKYQHKAWIPGALNLYVKTIKNSSQTTSAIKDAKVHIQTTIVNFFPHTYYISHLSFLICIIIGLSFSVPHLVLNCSSLATYMGAFLRN